jgi:L,D-peptidoglycan transpeptidase YkuD (ErfK/YbiS/YcfS/YnhG family)
MKNNQVLKLIKLLLAILLLCVGCARVAVREIPQKTADNGAPLEAAMPQTRQLLVVVGEGEGSLQAKLFFLERDQEGWEVALGPIPATVGRNGFAEPGQKREGDGKTPSGLFELEHVFGYAPTVATKMPYRQATEDDIWVDDPESPDYNQWVKKGSTTASSYERMKLPDHRYRHGIVIGYNRNPVVKGMGSAIFIHVWESEGKSTSGCVALDEAQLVRIISLLDPAKKPMILMGNQQYIAPIVSPETLQKNALYLPPDVIPQGGGEQTVEYRPVGSNFLPVRKVREAEGLRGAVDFASLQPPGFPDLHPLGGREFVAKWLEAELEEDVKDELDIGLVAGKAPASGSTEEEMAVPAATSGGSALEQEIRAKVGASAKGLVEHRGKDGFFGIALSIPEAVEQEMRQKRTWREDCPVAIKDLNYLVLGFWGFDGETNVGELVVHRKLARAVLEAFGDLYALRFPIERMELIERYDGDDHRSMEANNTSAFNCREIAGRPGVFSNHSYGSAIDINPVQNPYVVPRTAALKALGWDGSGGKAAFLKKLGYPATGAIEAFCLKAGNNCRVSPESGRPFVGRSLHQPGLLVEGPALEAFTSRGFEWGGAWVNLLDYQHLEVKPAKLK